MKPLLSRLRGCPTPAANGGRQVTTSACSILVPLLLAALLLFQQLGLAQDVDTAPAQPQGGPVSFSGLTIIASGDQEFDLFTGVTTLPQGGQIVSQQHGLTLVGSTISYREGEFIEAGGVTVTTDFATANADNVRINLQTGDMQANGQVRFDHESLSLTAPALSYVAAGDVVRFEGPVRGEGVDFEAASMILDVASGAVILIGPYRYQDALFELAADRQGALLALTPASGDLSQLRASTDVDPALLERLAPYLP